MGVYGTAFDNQQALAKTKSYENPAASFMAVPKSPRAEVKGLVLGGFNSFTTEVSPTSFIPGDTSTGNAQQPDYYRYGFQDIVVQNGQSSSVWSPIQEAVESRRQDLIASIRLVDETGLSGSTTVGKSDQIIPEYTKFFLEAVQEGHQEKFQVVETFNDWYAFFYGERPATYTLSGYLLNLHNYNWYNEFMYFYQNYWRGTKAVERKARVILTYNYQQIQGYVLNIQTNLNAVTDKAAPFSMTILVTKRNIFNGTADDGILRDNYLPQTDNGLINTNADAVTVKLTSEVLSQARAARKVSLLYGEDAARTANNSSQSSITENFPVPF